MSTFRIINAPKQTTVAAGPAVAAAIQAARPGEVVTVTAGDPFFLRLADFSKPGLGVTVVFPASQIYKLQLLRVSGLNFRGGHISRDLTAAFFTGDMPVNGADIVSSSRITIEKAFFSLNNNGVLLQDAQDIRIADCVFETYKSDAINAGVASTRIAISGNRILKTGRGNKFCYYNDGRPPVFNVGSGACVSGGGVWADAAHNDAMQMVGFCSNVTIEDNFVDAAVQGFVNFDGQAFSQTDRILVANNVLNGIYIHGINIAGDDVEIRDNSATGASDSYANIRIARATRTGQGTARVRGGRNTADGSFINAEGVDLGGATVTGDDVTPPAPPAVYSPPWAPALADPAPSPFGLPFRLSSSLLYANTPRVAGVYVSAQPGQWVHEPTSFEYRWRRGDYNAAIIPGANAGVYQIQAGDGFLLSCEARGTNAIGTSDWYPVGQMAINAPASAQEVIPIVLMGQSNIKYITAVEPTYNLAEVPRPTMTAETGRYVGYPVGAPSSMVDREFTNANVSGRLINIGMAVLREWLHFVAPTKIPVFVDWCVSGVSRTQLADDADTEVQMANYEALLSHVEANYGTPQLVVEFWYANDASGLNQMLQRFAPLYLGQLASGAPFTLGAANAEHPTGSPKPIDHCLWDVEAAPDSKGRGKFRRDATKWTYVRNHHKDSSLAVHQGIEAFHADSRVQTFAAPVGTWGGHYANNQSHALTDDPDGQVFFAWAFAPVLGRHMGLTIGEPEYAAMEVAEDGAYADILVSLPNGGTLSTTRIVEERPMPDTPLPYQQEVTGIEIARATNPGANNRQPVFKLGNIDKPQEFRGTVSIVDAGSGSPRVGRIRVTPELPFINGDRIYCMWMDGLSQSQNNPASWPQGIRPQKPWLDYPIERVEALRDPNALYKYPGVPVRPYESFTVSGLGEVFEFQARSAATSTGNYLRSSPFTPTITRGEEGMLSVWLRYTGATWNSPSIQRVFQLRSGGAIQMDLYTHSSGRLLLTIGGGVAARTIGSSGQFTPGQWLHLLASWKTGAGGWYQVALNNAAAAQGADLSEATLAGSLDRMGVGADSGGNNNWTGDIGHLYINLQEALNLNVEDNRRKFISPTGTPVSLGEFGELPTGDRPAFYFDGPPETWNNVTGGPAISRVGTLAAGGEPFLS
ncbi:MAG: LamG-like jellyroll fold domain-containing protein [Gemmobacter sp.]